MFLHWIDQYRDERLRLVVGLVATPSPNLPGDERAVGAVNGEYLTTDGAISASHVVQKTIRPKTSDTSEHESGGPTWQECDDRYLEHHKARRRKRSIDDTISRLGIAETILEGYDSDNDLPGGMLMHNIATLETGH